MYTVYEYYDYSTSDMSVRQVNVNHYEDGRVVVLNNNIRGAACNDIWNITLPNLIVECWDIHI